MHIPIIKLYPDSCLPQYQTEHSAGMDLHAYIPKDINLNPLQRIIIGTGIAIALSPNYEAQIRSRSGLTSKQGIICLNAPGTIDSDYRGEIKVILYNTSQETFTITNEMRIAQMVITSYFHVTWNHVETLNTTTRGNKGFGSTGSTS